MEIGINSDGPKILDISWSVSNELSEDTVKSQGATLDTSSDGAP